MSTSPSSAKRDKAQSALRASTWIKKAEITIKSNKYERFMIYYCALKVCCECLKRSNPRSFVNNCLKLYALKFAMLSCRSSYFEWNWFYFKRGSLVLRDALGVHCGNAMQRFWFKNELKLDRLKLAISCSSVLVVTKGNILRRLKSFWQC